MLGIPMSEDENNASTDLKFLEEVMDINETLDKLTEKDYEPLDVLKRIAEGESYIIHDKSVSILILCRLFARKQRFASSAI